MTFPKKTVKTDGDTIQIPTAALVALAAALAPFVAEMLRGSNQAAEFTSLALPPHTSRRAFRERCKSIPTAKKTGHVWTVPRSDWFASFARGPVDLHMVSVERNDDAEADALLAAAGLRPTMRRAS